MLSISNSNSSDVHIEMRAALALENSTRISKFSVCLIYSSTWPNFSQIIPNFDGDIFSLDLHNKENKIIEK